MTLLYSHTTMQAHQTGRHPECPARLASIEERLEHQLPDGVLRKNQWSPITLAQLERIHPAAYHQGVQQVCASGGGALDPDTIVSEGSHEAACLAAGAAADAVDAVLQGNHSNALCLVRPPGHHALAEQAMGFCLFNNIAIAARHALEAWKLNRILIIDWDVHHGNGTQDLFWTSPQVGFFSAHRWPFYPGSGAAEETGSGDGLGSTSNLPLTMGITRADYLAQFEHQLVDFAERIQPELILVSAGFDCHRLDPVGSLGLESEDFIDLTRCVKQVAESHCENRLVSVLEGGYHLDALAESVQLHLAELATPLTPRRLPEQDQVQEPDDPKDHCRPEPGTS